MHDDFHKQNKSAKKHCIAACFGFVMIALGKGSQQGRNWCFCVLKLEDFLIVHCLSTMRCDFQFVALYLEGTLCSPMISSPRSV